MKIVCDKCATKYSIADEKVRGKVFKIRCKKCSHIIVVKGGEVVEGDAGLSSGDSTVVAPSGDSRASGSSGAGEQVWYLVMNGEQVGPFHVGEVREKLARHEIDGETYAWREGFGDWLHLSGIDELGELLRGAAAGANGTVAEAQPADVADVFAPAQGRGAQPGDAGADIFGSQAATVVARPPQDLFGGQPAASAGPFGSAAAEPAPVQAAAGVAAGAAAAAPASADEQKLTGQRNETSVLFSLSNLQALATGGGAARVGAASSAARSTSGGAPGTDGRPGFTNARNEGSGLIDIRAMAAATLSSVGPSSPFSDSAEFPTFSAAPMFSPVVAAPLMMPSQDSGMPKWVWAVIALGLVTFVGIASLVVALVLRKPELPAAAPVLAVATTPASSTGATAGAPAVAGAPTTTAAAAAAPEGKAAEKSEKAEKTDSSERGTSAAKGGRHDKTPPASKKPGGDKPAAVAVATPAPSRSAEDRPSPKASRKLTGDDLDDLLNSATANSSAAAKRVAQAPRAEASAASSAEDANLPDQLDRSEILAGMKGVTPRAMACYQQYHVPGVAMVNVVIAKSGRVQSAAVGGALSGTPTGDCVSRAVKSASFKRFKGATMSIQYPFQLR